MYAVAVYDFRLTKKEFYELSFAQFTALSTRMEARQEIDDMQHAYTRMVTTAPHQKKSSRLKLEDFLLFGDKKETNAEDLQKQMESNLQMLSLENSGRHEQKKKDKENERLAMLASMKKINKK